MSSTGRFDPITYGGSLGSLMAVVDDGWHATYPRGAPCGSGSDGGAGIRVGEKKHGPDHSPKNRGQLQFSAVVGRNPWLQACGIAPWRSASGRRNTGVLRCSMNHAPDGAFSRWPTGLVNGWSGKIAGRYKTAVSAGDSRLEKGKNENFSGSGGLGAVGNTNKNLATPEQPEEGFRGGESFSPGYLQDAGPWIFC